MPKNTSNKPLFIFAGEQSGDLHGSHLIKAMQQLEPSVRFTGVGGPQMRFLGVDCLLNMEDFELMGFSDVLLGLPKQIKQFLKIKNYILTQEPALVILIDYPGFNLRLASSLRKSGYKGKIVQYISPTVWAWGKKRIRTMSSSLDLLLAILPFEPACFKESGLAVQYVGHPTVESLKTYHYDENWLKNLGQDSQTPLIALFPGSRKKELLQNLPKQLAAAKLLKETSPSLRFGISCARQEFMLPIKQYIMDSRLRFDDDAFTVPHQYRYELMRHCHTAVAKSGTVTLELALHHKPTVVVYHVSKFNKFIAQHLLKLNLPHYCLVNILSGKRVFPELITEAYTAADLFHELSQLHHEGQKRNECISYCQQLEIILESKCASKEAAKAIGSMLC